MSNESGASPTPQQCPICRGRGFVSEGFYSTVTGVWSSARTATEQCRTCKGKGFVEVAASPLPTAPRLSANELEVICGACQILDVIKGEWKESWSDWDQSIRDGLSKMQLAGAASPTAPDEPNGYKEQLKLVHLEMCIQRERAEKAEQELRKAWEQGRDAAAEDCEQEAKRYRILQDDTQIPVLKDAYGEKAWVLEARAREIRSRPYPGSVSAPPTPQQEEK